MKLGTYPQPTTYASATYPAYYFNPPPGSDWAEILGAWDGQPSSALGPCILSGNRDVTGWTANCNALMYINFGSMPDNAICNVGDGVGPGFLYPFGLTSVENPANTLIFVPDPYTKDGKVASVTASGKAMSAVSLVALICLTVAAGAAVAAVAGAGAAGAGAALPTAGGVGVGVGVGAPTLTSAEAAAIYGDAGYAGLTTAQADALITTALTPAEQAAEAAFNTASQNALANSIAMNTGTALAPATAADLAAPALSASTLSTLTTLPSFTVTAPLAATSATSATSALPSASQIASGASAAGSIGKLIGGAAGLITGATNAANGINAGQLGTTSPGTGSILILAGFAAIILLGKRK